MKKKSKKKKFNDSNRQSILIILITIIVVILLGLFRLLQYLEVVNVDDITINFDSLTTVEDVMEYYDCELISQDTSTYDEYINVIYAKLGKNPYEEDDTSNRTYYDDIIRDIAMVLEYQNFEIIDEEKDLTIKVTCSASKVSQVLINDIKDYFDYMDSQKALEQYEEIPITDLSVSSDFLQQIIDVNFDVNYINLGTKESLFDKYDIYFDEGYEVRVINKKIFNIVFNKNYNKEIINGIRPGMDFSYIKDYLGKPTFEDESLGVVGYKGDKFYAFFTESEISIYKIYDNSTDEFFSLTKKYLDEEIPLTEYVSDLTDLWPDYEEYTYTSSSVLLSYPQNGVEISINSGDTNGILVYNNIRSSMSTVGKFLENTNMISRLKVDAIFENEKKRLNNKNDEVSACYEYAESITNDNKSLIGESSKYNFYVVKDSNKIIYSVKFISIDGSNPNRELNATITSYLWGNSNTFIFSKSRDGIFKYDLNTGKVTRLITSEAEEYEDEEDIYNFEGFENGILSYDDGKILEISL